ncbi:STAS domain-containing protein [uncultured Tateyamaria sp.]|uniref:STAS domain-containing protein n=1 Tax=uncultured Tateyamaria sp. TaxID=455651 RepID=UPI00260E8CA1|nr:STAS domain-containing protein [uncultured Tateyamaria sp.]
MGEVIALPRRLDAATAPALAADLLDYVQLSDLYLDARDTTHVGAMGAQVLLSAKRTMETSARTFKLLNLSDRARSQLSNMGLVELLPPEEDT